MPRQFGKVDASQSWSCDKCRRKHAPGAHCAPGGVWLVKGTSTKRPGVVWLVRPMPDGQWPVDQLLPRDDSFTWWVRSHCGHEGGAKQWAFTDRGYAEQYGQLFRENPCSWTLCPEHIKIKNKRSG